MTRIEKPVGQHRGQTTRTDIINAARRLFSEHGYHRTGIADIQDATGLTKGAFYHHFRSKEDLGLAILETAKADYDEHLIGPALKHASPAERIEALLDGAVGLHARPEWCNCQMVATFCAELTARDERLHRAVQAMQLSLFELWRDLIAQARQAGQADEKIEPATAAEWIMSTLSGLLLARKLGTAQVPAQHLIELMKRVLLKAAGPTRAPGGPRSGQPHRKREAGP